MREKTYLERLSEACKKSKINFPNRIVITLYNKDKEFSIVFNAIKSTCKLENIKLDSAKSLFWEGTSAILGVHDIQNVEELEKHLNEYQEKWLKETKKSS